jgi:toxin ParE1/3/4
MGDGSSRAAPEMRRVVWTEQARDDLVAIQAYVGGFSPTAAARLAARLIDLVEALRVYPERGRPIRHGLREAVSIRPYVIRYAILPDEIRIITVRHAARRPDGEPG